MVQLPSSAKIRPDPVRPAAEAAVADRVAVKVEVEVEVEDPLEDEHGPFNKRSKHLTPPQQEMYNNVLDEPSPLGLRLRKSPSLLDLIQMRLTQASSAAASGITSIGLSESGKKKELKSTAVSGTIDRLKASNFPANLLRIGTWEYVSRYEGDLVAKCYFAKHKLVWEVLEGGLKSKIEIQWSDITSLKASCSENESGTLEVVLARPPLFFRETDPQPRKHTLWQATSDFTGGQASMQRKHFLQSPQSLLSKNFEKLIQCDPRLNLLSQQPDIIVESPYFEPRCSIFEDQVEHKRSYGFNDQKDDPTTTFSGFGDPGSPCATSSISGKSEIRDSIGKAPEIVSQATSAPRSAVVSVPNTRVLENNAKNPHKWWEQLKVPRLRGSMSVDDLVNHIGNCISEQIISSGNASLPPSALPTKEMLEDVAQYLLSDNTQASVPSDDDEISLMARVNSLCCLIQKDGTAAAQNPKENGGSIMDVGDDSDGSSDDEAESAQEAESGLEAKPQPITRKESFGELLMNLPRIASFPQFLFKISEDAENEAR
ncbi:uncharacterized protein LOC109706590 isoform X2 [Ananas comosus]|uniref:Uncharacterized protein LOC109706590 isoform X2 n=1 Tax=Ananas comosus TaxID=4615 RepID=A0A6P5EIA4_ANACO|nr:uncharacterized protein LOC109706590 isoform X2 [Ananas comosus]